ncbi:MULTISPECIES: DUF3375 domain-containing protein [Pseudomonas]|uniref:DUF3375 domain-containing protein n=1 Tax=Pseudomonas putida (strain ATCC 47054 / DSM 6125 / CFBP 8728 / NCIMB 11950 / KT2440) TaxID=160488 RepID=Q88GM3_PSEPK|nr:MULTISPECIES: DUF3375 domain-containing protein [Pseudomonas]AAN69295.1 conserved protein of unknown function [Pseudomonas putida KT2440]MDD2079539.1 DUF3375 domain-containing protein [Pseudomonas putida]PXZ50298.1 DUF3375 domain-containing protein [Pseudomonas sp. SMT-1]QDW57467.1 DUF3375 domain-containing protein [Pseudomonas sp. KBS0802]QXZ06336.1 DUF3375 domain-containing protein [Pseudomonas putida]
MEDDLLSRAEHYSTLRTHHPAWLLLASLYAPLVLSSLRTLFEHGQEGIDLDDALHSLAQAIANNADQEQSQTEPGTALQQANRELGEWIKRRLIVERSGRLYATDALESAFRFVDSLDDRVMTSTASRLSVVQREIENLETNLNSDPKSRALSLKRRIRELQIELDRAKAGHVPIFDEAKAIEGIREIYALATSLGADFRRVEDSWRNADRLLRQSIISDQCTRGEVLDNLLDGQDALLTTPEGKVFDSFQLQLRAPVELDLMRTRIRNIMRHPAVPQALHKYQQTELLRLVPRLLQESAAVLRARARSERDVKSFLKTGLVAEHHRVGHLLNEFLSLALRINWQRQAIRRTPVPIPPVGMALFGVPAVERLRFKAIAEEHAPTLDLTPRPADLEQIEDEFWQSFDGLDRDAFVLETLRILAQEGRPLSLAELASLLPPTHDLECFTLWITMAREAGLLIDEQEIERFDLADAEDRWWRFNLPFTQLESEKLQNIKWEL